MVHYVTHSFSTLFQINTLMADGDITSLRKAVTEKMYSVRYPCFYIPFFFFLCKQVAHAKTVLFFILYS